MKFLLERYKLLVVYFMNGFALLFATKTNINCNLISAGSLSIVSSIKYPAFKSMDSKIDEFIKMFRSQSNFFRSSKKEKNHADEKEDIENQQTSDTECHSNFKVNISHENKHQDIIIENPDEINQSPALLPAVGAYILASADMLVETLQDLRIMDPEGTLLDEVESEENIQDTEKNEDLHGRPINEVLKDELPVSTGSSHDSHQLLYQFLTLSNNFP